MITKHSYWVTSVDAHEYRNKQNHMKNRSGTLTYSIVPKVKVVS